MTSATTADQLKDFLGCLFPSPAGFIECRALPIADGGQRWFSPGDLAGITRFLQTHASKNLFFGVAARLTRGDGSLANCAVLHTLFVDADFKTTPESEVRARLERFPLKPSIVVMSGGGLHLYWLLKEPIDLQAPGEAERAKGLLRRLALALAGDLVAAEPARILRVPGTVNQKYDPARAVLIEAFDAERCYNTGDFDDLLPPEPETNGDGPFALPQKIEAGGRNDTLYRLARSCRAKEMSAPAILAALREENRTRCVPPLSEKEVEQIAHHAATQADRPEFQHGVTSNASESGDGEPTPKGLSRALVEYSKLLTLEIPERRRHTSWLPEASSALAYGPRGVGKTMWGLGLGAALVTGEPFLRWPITGAVGCLYIDGEMQIDELRSRATALLPTPPRAPLLFLPSELAYHRLNRDLVLTADGVREEVAKLLGQHPEIRVVIFDNISTLFCGIDEDRKRDWEPIAAWLIRLRHRGLATVLIHHSGKGGQQRGTSGREDSLDTVIQLDRPAGYDPREGCHFELRFTKSRSVKGEDVAPLDVTLTEQDGQLQWAHKTLEESHFDQLKRLFGEGVTSPTEIAEELGITKGYASKLVRKARAEQEQR